MRIPVRSTAPTLVIVSAYSAGAFSFASIERGDCPVFVAAIPYGMPVEEKERASTRPESSSSFPSPASHRAVARKLPARDGVTSKSGLHALSLHDRAPGGTGTTGNRI